jgi:hypothetical protein
VIVKHDAPQYNTYNEYNQHYSYTDNSIHADTAIVDSFNQDNDGVDNKGGVISHSNVANGDQTDVGNSAETTTLTDSLNTDAHHDTAIVDSGNDSSDHSATVANSHNDSSSHTTADVNGSFNADQSVHVGAVDDGATALHAVDARSDRPPRRRLRAPPPPAPAAAPPPFPRRGGAVPDPERTPWSCPPRQGRRPGAGLDRPLRPARPGRRLRQARARLLDDQVRVLVVGEFKQGKSMLVNSLVSAPVCPVFDDIATAVSTVVRYARSRR